MWLYNSCAATTAEWRASENKFHHHFQARIRGLYEAICLSHRSTPPMPWLYIRVGRFGGVLNFFSENRSGIPRKSCHDAKK